MERAIPLLEKTPILEKDIKVFKLVFTPSEMFVLKYFIDLKQPITIRKIYSEAIVALFNQIVLPDRKDLEHPSIKELRLAGYGNIVLSEGEKKKAEEKIFSTKGSISVTNFERFCYAYLQDHKAKLPSYDKFKNIVDKFVLLGVLSFIGKSGKNKLYTINPFFYNKFKDKFQEILNL
jgi:hypothetical protein